MYNQQLVKARIKYLCECRKITVQKMLLDLGYGRNLLTQATSSRGISGAMLYAIADYLDVSVDYILGRTEKPEINK